MEYEIGIVGTIRIISRPSDGGGGAAEPTTWDPTQKGADLSLDASKLWVTYTGVGTAGGVRATRSAASGLKHFEIKVLSTVAGFDSQGVGICSPNFAITAGAPSYLGNDNHGIAAWSLVGAIYLNNTTSTDIGSGFENVGDIVSVAVDHTLQLIWWRVNGGAWGPSGDPASGTGGSSWAVFGTTTAFPAVFNAANYSLIANFGATPYAFTPPAGASNY